MRFQATQLANGRAVLSRIALSVFCLALVTSVTTANAYDPDGNTGTDVGRVGFQSITITMLPSGEVVVAGQTGGPAVAVELDGGIQAALAVDSSGYFFGTFSNGAGLVTAVVVGDEGQESETEYLFVQNY